MGHRSYANASRLNWGREETEALNQDQIKLGCLQRIADATEAMARWHVELARERDNYKRWYEQEQERRNRAERRIIALRGVITRQKRKAAR